MPADVAIVDLAMGARAGLVLEHMYHHLLPRPQERPENPEFPVQYLFKQLPVAGPNDAQGAELLLPQMDRYGIEIAMIALHDEDEVVVRTLADHPDRFVSNFEVDPHAGMAGVRKLVEMYERYGIKAASAFPAGYLPQVPIGSKKMYPFYAKCVELDIPIIVNAGVPGPLVPMACQDVAQFDEVCFDFPELRIVMRHGGEPWIDLAVKLMLKWPGLHYMTSAFAPKYYPTGIVDFANTRGADKVMYAGYFPMGLTLDRIFDELPRVGLRDEVWPKFLRTNALRVFRLDG